MRLKSVGLFTIGWSHPMALGADIIFARRTIGEESQLYVPGSSLKGALRSSASRVAKAYNFRSCAQTLPERIRKHEEHRKSPCDVCKIFGWPDRKDGEAKLFVSDLLQQNAVQPFSSTRIRISDDSGTVAEGALFVVEQLPLDSEFKGEVCYKGLDGQSLGLLLLAFAELRLGRIGRRSLVDIKLEETDELVKDVDARWKGLLSELGDWLWK